MANTKTSLKPHAVYPAIPEQATTIQQDTGCAGCSLAQSDGHKSCSSFKLHNSPEVLPDNRINLKELRQIQGQLHRRAFDHDGIVGCKGDTWYPYNAAKAANFVWFSIWDAIAVNGDTVTLQVKDTETGNAKQVPLSIWSEREQVYGTYTIAGFESFTSVQPLDMLEFQYPSKAHALKSKILQVIETTETTLTLKLDKDVSIAPSFFPVDGGQDQDYPDVKVYHYGRESEDWRFVIEPHHFLGHHATKTITTTDLPSDKIWIIEVEKVVAPIGSGDDLAPNFTLEGLDSESEWQTIDATKRLHSRASAGSSVVIGTTVPEGSIVDGDDLDDLTETYSSFRASYYYKTTADDTNCKIVGFDRCFNSLRDCSNSVRAYTENGTGLTGEDEAQQQFYCNERVYEKFEYVDDLNRLANPPVAGKDGIPDRVNVTQHHPAGLAEFPQDGACVQINYCEKFQNSITKIDDRMAPFNQNHSMGMLLDIWFAGDKTIRQKYVLAQGATGYVVERSLHPSILWFIGYYKSLATASGWNPKTSTRGDNSWSITSPTIILDEDGNQSLMQASGLERGYLLGYVEADDAVETDPDRLGTIPKILTTDYTTKRDPFDPGATVTDDLLEYIGVQMERDTLKYDSSRGLSGIAMALGQEDILCPNFDLSLTTKQTHTRSTFERDSVTGDGIIKIMPYRQPAKAAVSLGTRTIHSVTSLGDGKYEIQLENTQKTFSKLDTGGSDPADSYNKIYSVSAGGGPCVLPYESQGLSSFDGDKDTGSRAAGAQPLDCIKIGDNDEDCFAIESVGPHMGDKADTWGNHVDTKKGSMGGYQHLPVANDADGDPLTPITDLTLTRDSDSQAFTIVDAPERPALLVDQAWYDGDQRLYYTAPNSGDVVTLTYKDSAETVLTGHGTIPDEFTVTTALDYTDDFMTASTQEIYIGADLASVTTAGGIAPATGECRVDEDGSGKLTLTFSIDDAPNPWRLVLTYDELADAPDDGWCVSGNYTTFGKKRDQIVVRVDQYNLTDYFAATAATGEDVEFLKSASVFLPQENLVVEWTDYKSDAWAAIPPGKFTPNAASGTIRIHADWLTENFDSDDLGVLDGVVCFRVRDVQMIDQRGHVPASILNKTQAVMDQMQWVMTRTGTGFGDFSFSRRVQGGANLGSTNPEDPCGPGHTKYEPLYDTSISPNSNHVWTESAPQSRADCKLTADVAINSAGFGSIQLFENLPDNCSIEKCVAVISAAGITSDETSVVYDQYDCDGNETVPYSETHNPSFSGITYAVVGFTSANDYDIIGTVGAAKNGSQVVDITTIARTMYDERGSGKFTGYGLLITPDTALAGYGFQSMLPGEPAVVDVGWCEGDTCFGRPNMNYVTAHSTSVSWTIASIGDIAIKIDYHDTDKIDIVQPRFPSMVDLPD